MRFAGLKTLDALVLMSVNLRMSQILHNAAEYCKILLYSLRV